MLTISSSFSSIFEDGKGMFYQFEIFNRFLEWWNKTGILPNCSCVSTTVWLLNMDFNKTLEEKVRLELYKYDACCSEQVQEAAPHRTVAIGPHTANLTNYPRKMNKICWSQLEKQEWTYKQDSLVDYYTDTQVLANQQKLTYISCVRTLDAMWKTCQAWWLIEMEGERESQGNLGYQHKLRMMINYK